MEQQMDKQSELEVWTGMLSDWVLQTGKLLVGTRVRWVVEVQNIVNNCFLVPFHRLMASDEERETNKKDSWRYSSYSSCSRRESLQGN